MTNLEDKDILAIKVGDQTVQELSALSFLHWVSKKINGVPAYSGANQELVLAVSHPPLSSNMPDTEKIRLVRKMISINIEIP